jgi:hypothetical protein
VIEDVDTRITNRIAEVKAAVAVLDLLPTPPSHWNWDCTEVLDTERGWHTVTISLLNEDREVVRKASIAADLYGLSGVRERAVRMIEMVTEAEAAAEHWRPVVGFEGMYAVSDFGRVRSIERNVLCKNGSSKRIHALEMKVGVDKIGRHYVRFSAGNVHHSRKVHHLVLEAFVGPRPFGKECCHNDGNPGNNHVSNLRWDTRSSNVNDAIKHGTHWGAAKTRCKNGHEFNKANTRWRKGYVGRRDCRACQRDRYAAKVGRKGMRDAG